MPIVAGLHYYYHEGGDPNKPPLLLIHGEGGDHLSWPSEVRRLPGYRVYALDLPGHGHSEGPGLQSVPAYVDSLLQFMNRCSLSRAVLVGQGLGGAIALALACRSAERLAGLVLVASGARLPVAAALLENADNASTYPAALQALLSGMCTTTTDPRLQQAVSGRLSAVRRTLLVGDLRACESVDLQAELASIRTPVLVVCGTEDRLTPLRLSEQLAGAIPGAALQTIDGSGHLVALEQPRRLAGLLSVFLATVAYHPGA